MELLILRKLKEISLTDKRLTFTPTVQKLLAEDY